MYMGRNMHNGKIILWPNQSIKVENHSNYNLSNQPILPLDLLNREPRQQLEALNIFTQVAGCSLEVYAKFFYRFALNKISLLLLQISVGFNFNSLNKWPRIWKHKASTLSTGNISIPTSSLNVFASYMASSRKRQLKQETWTQGINDLFPSSFTK